ncbi:MAG: sugar ABC transporter permease [Candidatus Hydrogenedens sp.]|nr:sugar ABC transporter permease [Candidatus Hydrogenedentota bacterium]NLF58936.1 sugar ABC transporter permease [Candidatus Hydrogenedens sp.]
MTRREKTDLASGLLFALPWLVGFLGFTLYPLVMSVYYSFTSYNVVQPPVWAGLDNYRELFFQDPLFWKALYNTLYFTAFSVPLSLAAALFLALLLNQKVPGLALFRTVFFLPSIVPIVASSVLWIWVLNPQSGLVNSLLMQWFGVEGPGWLASPAWSKPSLVVMSLWGVGGAMVIFLAGLADVPQTLYEVAELDGAGVWTRFRHVTLPMLTPTILFNLVMGLIASFQYFTQVYVMTGGKGTPLDTTMFYALYMYRSSFYYLRMGYASAMAWMLFVVILAATVGVLVSSKRWVFYHGD